MADISKNEIATLLEELNAATGIDFTISGGDLSDEELTRKLTDLLSFAKNGNAREEFLKKLLRNELSPKEKDKGLHRFRLDKDESQWSLLVISLLEEPSPDQRSVLQSLLTPGEDELICMSTTEWVLLHRGTARRGRQQLLEEARRIVDTMDTEAMLPAVVGFDPGPGADSPANGELSAPAPDAGGATGSAASGSIAGLAQTYHNASCALMLRHQFALPARCVDYSDLGIHRLVASIPKDAARTFLDQEFSGFSFRDIDQETLNTIHTLFNNGLNISETARELYLHRNTLVYRLDKFQKQSNLDLRKFDDAMACQIGLLLTDYTLER